MKLSIKFFCGAILIFMFLELNPHSEVFFSPDDSPTKRLIEQINLTQRRIYAAVYMLTDKQVAEALVRAKYRGVSVKIIVDKASAEYEYGKANMLRDAGIEVSVFTEGGKPSKYSALMHNKFALLDNKVWTGSFNWTKSANQKNQENVILTTNKKVCKRFEDHFEVLKKRCQLYKPARKRVTVEDSSDKSLWEKLRDLIFQMQPTCDKA